MVTKSYHHGNLRAALIEAAVELAAEGGPDAVVLREMARRVGVSHNAAYRHFADRDEVLGEVAAHAMSQLERAMLEGIEAVDDADPRAASRQRLRVTGRAYVHFALANPGLFHVAFAGFDPVAKAVSGAQAGEGEVAAPLEGPYGVLNRVLDEMAATGAMPAERRPGAEVTCWAAVHGFADLHLTGPLVDATEAEREAALEQALEVVDRGLTAAD